MKARCKNRALPDWTQSRVAHILVEGPPVVGGAFGLKQICPEELEGPNKSVRFNMTFQEGSHIRTSADEKLTQSPFFVDIVREYNRVAEILVRQNSGRLQFGDRFRSEEHTSELQSLRHLVCRLL